MLEYTCGRQPRYGPDPPFEQSPSWGYCVGSPALQCQAATTGDSPAWTTRPWRFATTCGPLQGTLASPEHPGPALFSPLCAGLPTGRL